MTWPNATSTQRDEQRASAPRAAGPDAGRWIARQPSIRCPFAARAAPSLRPARGGVRALMSRPGTHTAGDAPPRTHPTGGAAGRAARHLPRVTLYRLRRLLGRHPRGHMLRVLAAATACSSPSPPPAGASPACRRRPSPARRSSARPSSARRAPGAGAGLRPPSTCRCVPTAPTPCCSSPWASATRRRTRSRSRSTRRLLPAGRGGARAGGRLVDGRGERRRRPRPPPPARGHGRPDALAVAAGRRRRHGDPGRLVERRRARRAGDRPALAALRRGGQRLRGRPGCDGGDLPPGPGGTWVAACASSATAANGGGSTVAASAPSEPVAARNTLPPALHGTAADGQTLDADPGAWNGVPGLDLAYAWERCSPSGTACAPIAGAAGPTYGPDRRTSAPRSARSCARRRRGRPQRRHRQR